MLSKIFIPYFKAVTICEKSFFKRMISLAAFATSVPTFMANPTLAFLRAGASLVPSPVTATLHKFTLSSSISSVLVYGDF